MKVKFENLYGYMPIFAQNMVCNMKGIIINATRYNKEFKICLKKCIERDSWNYSDICEYRDEQLRKIVVHSYQTVPYYHRVFKKINLYPDEIRNIRDIQVLPILDKHIINQNPQDFISRKAGNYKCINGHTSGTTGAGFKFTTSINAIHEQWAAFWRLYLKSGIKFGTKQGTFSSQIVVPIRQCRPPYWRNFPSQSRIYFSAYHENKNNLYDYFQQIEKNNIKWISGYPSLICMLAGFMKENGLEDHCVEIITTGAENLYDFQINLIKSVFKNARIGEIYGQAENVAIFTRCPGQKMIVNDDFSCVEFLENGTENFDIIGTNLYNYAMPLLRYKTGDIAKCKTRTNRRIVLQIDGRTEDYITLPNGIRLGKLDNAFKDATHIIEAQIYQKSDYSIEIRYASGVSDSVEEALKAKKWIELAVNHSVPVTLKRVIALKKTKAQKLRYVVSEIGE